MHGMKTLATALAFHGVVFGASAANAAPHEASNLDAISSTTAATAAAALACERPAARRYLSPTLRDLAGRRWGALPGTLEEDVLALSADAVHAAATRGDAKGDALAQLLRNEARVCSDTEVRAARAAVFSTPAAADVGAVERCEALPLVGRRGEPACSLALAARAALAHDAGEARAYLTELVVAAAFDQLYTGNVLSKEEKDDLFEGISYALREAILADNERLVTVDEDVARAFAGMDLEDVDPADCEDISLVRDLEHGIVDAQDAFCSSTRADLDPSKVVVTIGAAGGNPSKTDLEGAIRVVVGEANAAHADAPGAEEAGLGDELVAEALLCGFPLGPDDRAVISCAAGPATSRKSGTFKITIGSESWQIAVSPGKGRANVRVTSPEGLSLASVFAGAREALRLQSNVRALVRERFLGVEPAPSALRELTATALRVRRLARLVDDVDASSGQRSYLLGMLDALDRLAPRAASGPGGAPRCTADAPAIDRVLCAARGPARTLLAAAEEGDARGIAVRVTALLASPARPRSCSADGALRLMSALTTYVPSERPDDAAVRDLAAAELKAAARELEDCRSSPRGDHSLVALSLVPSVAVRASWNSAYVNAVGSDGFRVVPSLDVGSVRVRLSPRDATLGLGLRASLLDVLAPITELSMRRGDLAYDRQNAVWLELLRPRIEASLELRPVSRKLALVVGASMRTVAPFVGAIDPAAPKSANAATYLTPLSSAPVVSERFASFVETNLGVAYTF